MRVRRKKKSTEIERLCRKMVTIRIRVSTQSDMKSEHYLDFEISTQAIINLRCYGSSLPSGELM